MAPIPDRELDSLLGFKLLRSIRVAGSTYKQNSRVKLGTRQAVHRVHAPTPSIRRPCCLRGLHMENSHDSKSNMLHTHEKRERERGREREREREPDEKLP